MHVEVSAGRSALPTRQEIERRRHLVAQLWERNYTEEDIVTALVQARPSITASLRTVQRDIEGLLQPVREDRKRLADRRLGRQLRQIDSIVRKLMADALQGDRKAMLVMLEYLKQEAKLLGFAAPERLEVSGREGGPIEIAHLHLIGKMPVELRVAFARSKDDRESIDILERAVSEVPELEPIVRQLTAGGK